MTLDFAHASTLEGIRFTTQVGAPNVLLGTFRRLAVPTLAASVVGADYQGYLLVQEMVRKYGPDPFYVRVAKDEVLLVHHPDDIRTVLQGSPDPFAADPPLKKKGMAAFQPDALTISRGELWRDRRHFAERVLDTGKPLHRLSKTFLSVVEREVAALLGRGGEITWTRLNKTMQRITRIVIFGEPAADDVGLSQTLSNLMTQGNLIPDRSAFGYDAFMAKMAGYLTHAPPTCLAGLAQPGASQADTTVASQLVHWIFAMGDTLPANLLRAMALLASHPRQLAEAQSELATIRSTPTPKEIASLDYLTGCLLEAMRLWPTTQTFGRVTTREARIGSSTIPVGTQVLIYNVFNHRNRNRLDYADRFAPQEWTSGSARNDWTFNFFSHGPQGCPGAGLSLFLGTATLAQLLSSSTLQLKHPSLDHTRPLPHALNIFTIRLTATSRKGTDTHRSSMISASRTSVSGGRMASSVTKSTEDASAASALAKRTAGLRVLATTDPDAARDDAWAWIQDLKTRSAIDRAAAAKDLNSLFRLGTVPQQLNGPTEGLLVTTTTNKILDPAVKMLTDVWMPWQGKRFDAQLATGENWMTDSSAVQLKLIWPRYKMSNAEDGKLAFDFTTYPDAGKADPDVQVMVIDYANVESNPALIIRSIRDELVEIVPGAYLGKVLLRVPGLSALPGVAKLSKLPVVPDLPADRYELIGYFALRT